MKLGGPVLYEYDDPESWAKAVNDSGYKAANCPVDLEADKKEIEEYAAIAEKENIIIAECGVWNNPLIEDESKRKKALKKCKQTLQLADQIGAKCCVNIAGSRGNKWDGPHPDNLTSETFDMIVQIVREIIDEVRPENTYYSLEPMPWIYPDSADSYLELIAAIDRKRFAVHLDPVNIVKSPDIYFNNTSFLKNCFAKLGKYIKSCHAKDTLLKNELTVYLKEVRPGKGNLDYSTFLKELDKLDEDIPLMIEHLSSDNEYKRARDYIKNVARKENIKL
ncbi:MAG: sugar phosphate isomerase/epimerase family protein [Halanaerobiaceae bacterium]